MNYVFVYGTLRRGERNHYLLKNAKLLYEQAWTFGQLFDTPYHFPVLYESPNNKIYGELYEITEDELKLLDRLEGFEEGKENNYYERKIKTIFTDQGCFDAYVYIDTKRHIEVSNEILNGDWKVYQLEQSRPEYIDYFAYGSCMDHERFQKHGVDHYFQNVKGTGILNGYSLRFSLPTSDAGKADIVEDKVGIVEGIVYQIPFEATHYLYRREGVAIGLYRPAVITVKINGRNIENVLTFIVIDKKEETPPSCLYAKEIFRGAKGYLSEGYIKSLQQHVKQLQLALRNRKK